MSTLLLKKILSIFPRISRHKSMIQSNHTQGQGYYKVNREKRIYKINEQKSNSKVNGQKRIYKVNGQKQLYKVISQKNVEYLRPMEKKPTRVGFFTTLPRESAQILDRPAAGPRPAHTAPAQGFSRPWELGIGAGSWQLGAENWSWKLEAGNRSWELNKLKKIKYYVNNCGQNIENKNKKSI